MKKKKPDKTSGLHIIECACGHDMLVVEFDTYGDEETVHIGFWKNGHGNKYDWQFKLRTIWNVITRGHPYTDNVVLNKKEVSKLIKTLKQGRQACRRRHGK